MYIPTNNTWGHLLSHSFSTFASFLAPNYLLIVIMHLVLIVSIKRCGEVTFMELSHQFAVASGRQQTSMTHWEDCTFPGHKGGRGPVDDPERLACLQETSPEKALPTHGSKGRQHTHGGRRLGGEWIYDPGRAQAHGGCRRSWNSLPGSHLGTPFSDEQPLWTTKVTDLRAVVQYPDQERHSQQQTHPSTEREPDSRIPAFLLAWCLE